MGFTIIFTARGVRGTERPVSFIPKGALTHHPQAGGGMPAAKEAAAISETDDPRHCRSDGIPAGEYADIPLSGASSALWEIPS